MVVGAVLIICGLLAWLGVKKGVYTMAATLFNILIAIYAGVLSTPLVLKTSPGLETSGYYAAFCMLFLIVGCFVLLQGICFYFFLRGADIVFPDLFDKIGGGLLGFISGYALMGIVFLAVCMMPFSKLDFLQGFFPWERMESFCSQTTAKVCHFMATWSLEYLEDKPEEAIAYLVTLGQEETRTTIDFEIKSAGPSNREAVPEKPRKTPDPAKEDDL